MRNMCAIISISFFTFLSVFAANEVVTADPLSELPNEIIEEMGSYFCSQKDIESYAVASHSAERVKGFLLEGYLRLHDVKILDFFADKQTWDCHWFPTKESKPGGDPVNNLYAINGPLDKLDRFSGGAAREYEYGNQRILFSSSLESSSFAGHITEAAEVVCILEAPKQPVIMKNAIGQEKRFDNITIDALINTLNEWSIEAKPFIVDTDRYLAFSFLYDQVKIYRIKYDKIETQIKGPVKYYRIEIKSTGYRDRSLEYRCYSNGIESYWYKTLSRPPSVGPLSSDL